jgi:hypothetical protein
VKTNKHRIHKLLFRPFCLRSSFDFKTDYLPTKRCLSHHNRPTNDSINLGYECSHCLRVSY